MKNAFLPCLAVAGVAFLSHAAYLDGEISVEQADGSGLVTVTYALSQPAIVTLCVETNRGDGVFAEMKDTASSVGDVNRLVAQGSGKRIVWQPTKDFVNRRLPASDIRIKVKTWTKDVPPDYMAVDLLRNSKVRYYPHTGALPGGIGDRRYKTEFLVMRRIPAKGITYLMGANTNELGVQTADLPQHRVTFTNDFYMAVYELTQGQFMNIMRMDQNRANPSAYDGADRDVHPLETISYEKMRGGYARGWDWPDNGHAVDPNSVIAHLRTNTGISSFDLPTEARWEYAYRAGTSSALHSGKEITLRTQGRCPNLDEIAWNYWNTGYNESNAVETREVGLLQPNEWGLYDMSGNVQEVTNGRIGAKDGSDWYGATDVTDPPGPTFYENGVAKLYELVSRGGSFRKWAAYSFRAGTRTYVGVQTDLNKAMDVGYRLMCDIETR